MSERDDDTKRDGRPAVASSAERHASGKASMQRPLPRRFYQSAGVAADAEGNGFRIELDGRPVRTPARKLILAVPALALAEAIADEWSAQASLIDPQTMPLTRIANTAIDGVAQAKADVVAEVVQYAGSDLLFYRAEAPEGLVARQTEVWDPLVRLAERKLATRFVLAAGIMPVKQSAAAMTAVQIRAAAFDAFALTALHTMMTLTGSALLALLVAEGDISPEAAWAAAHVDEDWQIAQWGEDAEAGQRRRAREIDMLAAGRCIGLLAR